MQFVFFLLLRSEIITYFGIFFAHYSQFNFFSLFYSSFPFFLFFIVVAISLHPLSVVALECKGNYSISFSMKVFKQTNERKKNENDSQMETTMSQNQSSELNLLLLSSSSSSDLLFFLLLSMNSIEIQSLLNQRSRMKWTWNEREKESKHEIMKRLSAGFE